MVRFAAMDRIIDYGKIILIGVFVLAGILLNNFSDPNRYTHKYQNDGFARFDGLDGSLEMLLNDSLQQGWIKVDSID